MSTKSPATILRANSIGCFTYDQLAQPGRGRVLGSTSSGVFCLTASQRILFLTTEKRLGPLNIILDSMQEISSSCWLTAELVQSPDSLVFPTLGIQVNLANAKTWQPPPLPLVKTTAKERGESIQVIAREVLHFKRETILLPILKWLVNPFLQIVTPFISRFDWIEKREELSRAIQLNEPRRAALAFHPFLGMGTGLTPSGDDFICGFLLALSRWQSLLCPRFDLDKLGALLIIEARRSTTLLSASLVECASLGLADAGILSVLDTLFTGQMDVLQASDILLSYGSSSGLDVFAGMVTALEISIYHHDKEKSPQNRGD